MESAQRPTPHLQPGLSLKEAPILSSATTVSVLCFLFFALNTLDFRLSAEQANKGSWGLVHHNGANDAGGLAHCFEISLVFMWEISMLR